MHVRRLHWTTTMLRRLWPSLIILTVALPACGPSKPETYATRALSATLAREKLREEDETGRPPEVIPLIRKQRELLTRVAESMPTDPEGQRLLEQATEWYKEDVIDLWLDCRGTAQMLAKAKPPMEAGPRQILEGAVEVMQRLRIRPARNQSIRNANLMNW
jgi:hypothetical protein